MSIQKAYDEWSVIYDSNDNKTRDLEAFALREILSLISFDHAIEMGCGTGKNTSWLAAKARKVTAVDFSEQMLAKAREKINLPNVSFQ